jgi:ABC-type lipoprotein export system ATPase subunit
VVLIVVTHSAPLAECLPTRYDIRDGRLTPA